MAANSEVHDMLQERASYHVEVVYNFLKTNVTDPLNAWLLHDFGTIGSLVVFLTGMLGMAIVITLVDKAVNRADATIFNKLSLHSVGACLVPFVVAYIFGASGDEHFEMSRFLFSAFKFASILVAFAFFIHDAAEAQLLLSFIADRFEANKFQRTAHVMRLLIALAERTRLMADKVLDRFIGNDVSQHVTR